MAWPKGYVPSHGYEFEHILQDIQTLNERATRGELDISAISFHAYAYDQPSMRPPAQRREQQGDGYGPMLVARRKIHARGTGRKNGLRCPAR